MPVRLIESLSTTAPLAALFSDDSILRAMLDFEAALARVQGKLGIIPHAAASTISAVAGTTKLDAAAIASESQQSGTPAIPFVRAFTESVRAHNPVAAGFVHWGATSQDVCDTALVVLLQKAQTIFEFDLLRLKKALQQLSQKHRNAVMLGRTWLQVAPPVTFGLKAAGWCGAITRGHRRLNATFEDSLVLQFGGASGTLAALGKDGQRTAKALATELRLAYPDAPWHTQRDRLASLMCACGVITGSLGKMAQDILLLSQNEIGEVAEAISKGRGRSSTMPHKHNPLGSTLTLAAAHRVPGLVVGFLSSMVQEHERAAGGWQAEWSIVSSLIQNAGLAIASMAEVAEGLTVNAGKMRANIDATQGIIFAEHASMLLGKKIGRDKANHLLQQASQQSTATKRRLSEVLAQIPEITAYLTSAELRDLETPEHYLGVAEDFRQALLASSRSSGRPGKPGAKKRSRKRR
jgi:3-carboxy-cis,cis-muconate cycloisomerase